MSVGKGGLYKVASKVFKQISSANFHGELYGSRGHLYYLAADSNLYHYHGSWEAGGKPIISGLVSVVAHGGDWYGLDGGSRIYGGKLGRYIDDDGDSIGLWIFGQELLSPTRKGQFFIYDPSTQQWRESRG